MTKTKKVTVWKVYSDLTRSLTLFGKHLLRDECWLARAMMVNHTVSAKHNSYSDNIVLGTMICIKKLCIAFFVIKNVNSGHLFG